MMKHLNTTMIYVVVCMFGATQKVRAEIPPLTVVITADERTHFGKIVPIVRVLKSEHVSEIDFALGNDSKVSVTIRLRSDFKVLTSDEAQRLRRKRTDSVRTYFISNNLDRLARSLKKAGANRVSFEKVDVLPSTPFSVDKFVNLRKQKRQVIVICRADWDLPSTNLDATVLENPEVIRHVMRSMVSILIADVTEPPAKATAEFLKKYRASATTVLVFKPAVKTPSIHTRLLTAKEFQNLINVGKQ